MVRIQNMMKTDIREHEAGYELDIDLSGFKRTRLPWILKMVI